MDDLAHIPPARRPELIVSPLGDKGQHVIKDPRTGEFFTLGEQECFLLQHLDGARPARAICAAFEARFGEPLGGGDLDGFLDVARQQGLLQTQDARPGEEPAPPNPTPAPPPAPAAPPAPRPRQSILYWRKSLADPDRFLTWLEPRLRFLWTPAFVATSAAFILLAAGLAWVNRAALASSFADALRWDVVVAVWLTLVAATACHEFAHGLTCKHYGGEVHEIGFLMIFLTPAFYCNVSDSWLFREKSKRLWVMLAGGYCDLCLWALAVFTWRLTVPTSWLNYLAWVVLSVLGVRVFFNFNPLLKMDGYYLVSDWVEIPNLRQRSWGRLMAYGRWLLWGAERPAPEPRGRFLLGFGLVSWVFSLAFLGLALGSLLFFLGGRWGLAGGAAVVLLGAVTVPNLFRGAGGGEIGRMLWERHRKATAWGLALAGGGVVLLWPVQDRAGAPFQLRLGTRAELRAQVSGFIRGLYFDEGAAVPAGRPVARLDIPDLASRIAQKRAELQEVEARLYLLREGTRAEVVAAQAARVKRARAWQERARQDLERAQHALEADLARLDRLMDQYEAELDYAQAVYARNNRLYGTRAVAEEQYQETGKKRRVSLANLEQARAQKRARQAQGTLEAETELARREKALADAEEALDLLRLGPRAKEVEAESARRERVQEELRYLEGLQGRLLLTSPVAGTVTTPRLREKVGQYVKEGDLVCVVEVPEAIEAEVALSEQDVARVRPGQAVRLTVRAQPFETFDSRVDRVAPSTLRPEEAASGQHPAGLVPGTVPANINAYCVLNDPARQLRSGMTGYARISCGRRPVGAILVDRVLRFLRTEFW